MSLLINPESPTPKQSVATPNVIAGLFSSERTARLGKHRSTIANSGTRQHLLSPPRAQRITPPSDVISERFDDGSLHIAVTGETFDPDNPRHVAAAHRLFTVLDTLQEKLPPQQ